MPSIQIHEFFREFSEKYEDGRIVSKGYKNEVGPGTRDVPLKIKEAVERGDFRILDSYPPQGGEFALIGREINDKYSVLAVATSLNEDGSRPGVCYRYFWLEKPQGEDIDGIGTLLMWWKKVEYPKFEFNWHKKNLDFYRANTYSRNDFYQKQHRADSEVKNTIDQINSSSSDLKNNGKKISYEVWHYVALRLDKSSNFPISWAWNVRKLDRNKIFTMIYYANGKYEINKSQPENPNPDPFPPVHIDWQTLKNCLSDLAKDEGIPNQTKLLEIVSYLERYPILQWDWSQINDQKILKESTTPSGARYKALRAILGGERIQDWLEWLRKKPNQTFQETSLTIQAELLKASYNENTNSDNPNSAYNQLEDHVYEAISQMLLQCKAAQISDTQYQNITWLLVESKDVLREELEEYSWYNYLVDYAEFLAEKCRNYYKKLKRNRKDEKTQDAFIKQIYATLNNWETDNNKIKFPEYKKLALLFQKIKNYDLAAFFYQLSDGDVPENIYKNVNVTIIPLRKRRKKVDIRLIGAAVIAAIALTGGISFAILFPKTNTVSVKNNFILASNFERDLYLWDNKGDPQAKQRVIQFLKDELPDILKDKNKPENDDYRKNDSIAKTNTFIKNAYTPTVSLSQESLKNNNVNVKSGSPPNDIKVIQQMLKSIKDTSDTGELPFYSGDITGEFDAKTTEAIKNFQRVKMQLKPKDLTGTVGPGTWKKLQDLFRDEQTKAAKQLLLKSFQKRENDDDIKKDIKNLQNCQKKEAIEYIDCVQKLSKDIPDKP